MVSALTVLLNCALAVMPNSEKRLQAKLRSAYDRLKEAVKEKLGNKGECCKRVAEETMRRSICCLPLIWASLCIGASEVAGEARAAALQGSNGAALLRLILGKLSCLCLRSISISETLSDTSLKHCLILR